MVGRASVTRELGSPAALLDRSARNSRRSSSRASQRTAPVPELNTPNLTKSSISLPPTPVTSVFDEILPSAKRRRTQRALNSEDKSKSVAESPTHRALSEPFQTPNSHRSVQAQDKKPSHFSSRNSEVNDASDEPVTASEHPQNTRPPKLSEIIQNSNTDTSLTRRSRKSNVAGAPDEPETASTPRPNSGPSLSDQQSRDQGTASFVEYTDAKETPAKDASTDSPATMGAAQSQTRKTRKSMFTRLDGSASQENGTTPSKTASSSNTSTPQSSRRDRKSRLPARALAKLAKPHHTESTPPPKSAKPQENGVANTTPAKQPQSATPTASNRSRRERRSTRANDQTPSLGKEAEDAASPAKHNNDNESRQSQRSTRPSNTVTLNIGRKPLESILAERTEQSSNNEVTTSLDETPGHDDSGNYHFEYDSEMYRNNFGLDGHMDAPTSPTSLSTTTSTAARMSGRARKPTIRALESFESEQRFRRPRAASAKPSTTAASTADTTRAKPRSKAKQQQSTATTTPDSHPDVQTIAKVLYELAAAAVAPDFVPAPEIDTWLKELKQRVEDQQKQKEAEVSQPVEEATQGEVESTPAPNAPFSDNVESGTMYCDEDGWWQTGQENKHGEALLIVPETFEWFRPNNTYGDKDLPIPPIRVRSLEQAEKDRIFRYPPLIGERNLPADDHGVFLLENVPEERAKMKLKEEARKRGFRLNRFMPLAEMENALRLHDEGLPAPVPEDVLVEKAKEPSRKRRRAETSAAKPSDSAEFQKPKRRRQEPEPATTPSGSVSASAPAPETSLSGPSSPQEKKSLIVKFRFSPKNRVRLQQILAGSKAEKSKKRPRSDIDDKETTHSHDTRSPKLQKTSASNDATTTQAASVPCTPSKAAEDKAEDDTPQNTPDSAEFPETTPGGRPRRRATEQLMAGFKRHAEDRALRSERARLGHARRKGTPLKTVTAASGDTDTPSRPSQNRMNLD
ncbi:hypothetical protein BJX61DRAFT_125801 [Aspergillus egyptiacus]|nr:hypothetical protein BJX61DRAFT_125801 [Aspergillus egyptiacus]